MNLFTVPKAIALFVLVLVLNFAFTSGEAGVVDLKALLLVFCAPLCLVSLFKSESLSLKKSLKRLQELKKLNNQKLKSSLIEHTRQSDSSLHLSQLMQFCNSKSDSFLKFGAQILGSRFSAEESTELLQQKIESENQHWNKLSHTVGFLAKMAPYFGMVATVIGMVKLLRDMQDYSQISGGISMAMQGTLFGLISFTMIYAPIQKYINGISAMLLKRNQLIARWIVLSAEKQDKMYILTELEATEFQPSSPRDPAPSWLPAEAT